MAESSWELCACLHLQLGHCHMGMGGNGCERTIASLPLTDAAQQVLTNAVEKYRCSVSRLLTRVSADAFLTAQLKSTVVSGGEHIVIDASALLKLRCTEASVVLLFKRGKQAC